MQKFWFGMRASAEQNDVEMPIGVANLIELQEQSVEQTIYRFLIVKAGCLPPKKPSVAERSILAHRPFLSTVAKYQSRRGFTPPCLQGKAISFENIIVLLYLLPYPVRMGFQPVLRTTSCGISY